MKHWHETREVLDFLALVLGEGQRAALATVVRVRGSAYRHEGAKLAVAEDGTTAGNVSGGCPEQDVRELGPAGADDLERDLAHVLLERRRDRGVEPGGGVRGAGGRAVRA